MDLTVTKKFKTWKKIMIIIYFFVIITFTFDRSRGWKLNRWRGSIGSIRLPQLIRKLCLLNKADYQTEQDEVWLFKLMQQKRTNSPRPIYQNYNMIPRLSGHFSIFGLVFYVLKSLQFCPWSFGVMLEFFSIEGVGYCTVVCKGQKSNGNACAFSVL